MASVKKRKPTKKPVAKKAPAKKPAAKKLAANKPVAKKPVAMKPAAAPKPAAKSDLDRAVAFFKAYFDAEYATIKANYENAKNFAALDNKRRAMMTEQCSIMPMTKIDHDDLDDDFKLATANTLKVLAPRTLFLVEEYKVGGKKAFRGVVGTGRKDAGYYSEVFWANNANKIIAIYFGCASCDSSGFYQQAVCPDCRGKPWTRSEGDSIKADKPLARIKLVRPTNEVNAAMYDELPD